MIRASCHCGAVVLDVAEAPREVTDGNGSIWRRYGVLWAYYAPKQVGVRADEGTDRYIWGDRSIMFHRCRTCGCVTHGSAVDAEGDRMGVNARLMAPEVLGRARVRRLDGARSLLGASRLNGNRIETVGDRAWRALPRRPPEQR